MDLECRLAAAVVVHNCGPQRGFLYQGSIGESCITGAANLSCDPEKKGQCTLAVAAKHNYTYKSLIELPLID